MTKNEKFENGQKTTEMSRKDLYKDRHTFKMEGLLMLTKGRPLPIIPSNSGYTKFL